jgi:hypothetical protein
MREDFERLVPAGITVERLEPGESLTL